MSFTAGLYCSRSDRLYSLSPDRYVCGETGDPLVVVYDYQQLGEALETTDFGTGDDNRTVDRFAPLLPFREARALDYLQLRQTPLETLTGTDEQTVHLKDETQLPGGTTWTRGGAVLRGLLDEWGVSLVVGTNVGSSGLSLAELLAGDRRHVIVTPADNRTFLRAVPQSVTCYSVDLEIDELNNRLLQLVETEGWMFGTPGWNPYFREGLKTVAFELYEQLDGRTEAVYVAGLSEHPAAAVKKGFVELKKIGWIGTVPRVISVTPTDAGEFINRVAATDPAACGDPREARAFPGESLGGVDTVAVPVGDVLQYRGEDADPSFRDRPTGQLGLAALDREESGESAVVVATGLRTSEETAGERSSEELDGSIESLRETLGNLSVRNDNHE